MGLFFFLFLTGRVVVAYGLSQAVDGCYPTEWKVFRFIDSVRPAVVTLFKKVDFPSSSSSYFLSTECSASSTAVLNALLLTELFEVLVSLYGTPEKPSEESESF